MALQDNRKMYSISEVDPNTGLWSVNVQVVEIHRSQVTKNKETSVQRNFQRYLLADETGTKVSGVAYENDRQFVSNILHPFKRYRISNAKLTPAYGYFKVGDYGFSWVLKIETPIEPIAEPIPPTLPFNYTFCPYTDFYMHADKEEGFNIKGIVVHAFPHKEINATSSHREFVVIDESKTPIIMTLWNSFGMEEGNIIANDIDNNPVIIGVNMKASTFHGLSLGTRPYSCILINPPLTAATSLRQWYDNNKLEITSLVKNRAYKMMDLLLSPPDVTQTINVPTAITTLPVINTAWVSGRLRFTPTTLPYYICACANCYRKADTGSDWFLLCSNCGANEEVKLRCRIPVQLEGEGKTMQLVLTSPDVETLTGLTAEQMRDAHQYGEANPQDFNVNDDLLLALDRLHVLCFVKKYDAKTMGANKTPGLRFSVVKTYASDSLPRNCPEQHKTSATKPEGGPRHNKAQTRSKEKLIDIDNHEDHTTTPAQATTSAGIDISTCEDEQPKVPATNKTETEQIDSRPGKRSKNK